MDETLERNPKRLSSFFRSPKRKLLSLGRKAKDLLTYLPLVHVSGELDRIIIKSDSGVYNKFLIERAAKNELTYDMLASKPSNEPDYGILSKADLFSKLALHSNVVLISRSQDDHYKINIGCTFFFFFVWLPCAVHVLCPGRPQRRRGHAPQP